MYAIIEESGGQRKVIEGQTIYIDLYEQGNAAAGAPVTFDTVLVVGDEGGTARVGQPFVAGATVTAEIVEPVVKGDKVFIHKFRPKKGYKRKTGHRQRFTQVKITAIAG
jgi:large subunit ribosomal protein L21